MQPLKTVTSIVTVLALACTLLAPGAARAQLDIQETGFTVTDLGSSNGAKGVECSPGGIWGDFIYIADSIGDRVERVDFSDNMFLFSTLAPGAFPVGMAFGPGPGSNFGDFLYVACYGIHEVVKITPTGTASTFAAISAPSDCKFDPSGAYGNDMFVAQAYSGPIYKVDEFGTATTWSTVPSLYMRFGPGGAWGTGMYATSQSAVGIVTIDAAGVPTNFATGFTNPEGFDWAYGTGFDGDMFAPDVTAGQIWRIQSDGTKTLWATLPQAADVAFCNGALYIVTFHTGECYKVEPETPVAVTFADVHARVENETVRVTWDVFADEELQGFVVYRNDGDSDAAPNIVSGLLDTDQHEFVDHGVVPGSTYRYVVGALTPDGREISSAPMTVTLAGVSFAVSNYPNPFNPTTTIEYSLPEAAFVTLSIYDGKGRLVVDLEKGARPVGTHTATWNGLDARGSRVASGVYFYRLTAGNQSMTRKLVLLK